MSSQRSPISVTTVSFNNRILQTTTNAQVGRRASGFDQVTLWGSGKAFREFLHVDDLATAAVFLMLHYDQPEIINVGSGQDVTIRDLAGMIAQVTGFNGEIVYDTAKPDGTPRKLLDVSRLTALGWNPGIPLAEGIRQTYLWNCEKSIGDYERRDKSDAGKLVDLVRMT